MEMNRPAIFDKVAHAAGSHRQRPVVLFLNPANAFPNVVTNALDHHRQRSQSNGRFRSEHHTRLGNRSLPGTDNLSPFSHPSIFASESVSVSFLQEMAVVRKSEVQ